MDTRTITAATICLALAACGDIDTTNAAGSLRAKLRPGASVKAPREHPRGSAKKVQRAKLVRGDVPPPKDPQPSDKEAAPPEAVEPPPPTPQKESGKLTGITDAHNAVRTPLNIPKLEWSDALGGFAQQWADYLATENGCKLQHRPSSGLWGQKYGENIYWTSASTTVDEAISAWSSEAADYDHANNACSGICGHYTQMVWSDTRHLGCGVASCPGGGEMWVCNYDPRGNYYGQAPY